MIIDYPWYYVLLCLLVGAAYAVVLYFVGRRTFGKVTNVTLAVLRFVAVTVIALLLLSPVAKRTVHERQQPHVDLIEDRSLSVQMSADSAFALANLYEDIANHCRTTLSSDTSNVGRTDLGGMLDKINPDAAAVVLSSDGINNHGQNPVTVAEQLGMPVYTIALGDTTPRRDAALANLRHNRIAYLGNSFPVEITIGAHRLRGRGARLTVVDGLGHNVASQRVEYTDDDFSTTLSFNIKAEMKGLQKYVATLTVAEGEVELANNRQAFYVDVIDGRRKVLILANAPHPDLGAMKQAVESNPNYEACVITADMLQGGRMRLQDSNYSLVVLHNIPSTTHAVPKDLETLPKVYVIGCQTDLPRFNALRAGLEIVSRTKKSSEMTAVYNSGFSLFNLDAVDGEAVEQFPPLDVPFGEQKASASMQSLFTSRLGSIDTRQPLVAASVQGKAHLVFVWGEGLWKWRLADYQNNGSHEHFDRLISQMVNFAAVSDQRDRFIVETERHYSENESIVVNAQLYNDAYELFNTPDVTFTLLGDSANGDFNFTRRGDVYTLSLGRLPEGIYRYKATTHYDGNTLVAEGSFAVEALHLEQANLTADHTLLRSISAVTGGQMYYPDQLSELSEQLSTLKPVIYTHTRFSELIGLPWVLLLILLLLGAEWVLRKYYGEI